jgi:hypothetical protein
LFFDLVVMDTNLVYCDIKNHVLRTWSEFNGFAS